MEPFNATPATTELYPNMRQMPERIQDESRLVNYLMQNYDREVRPVSDMRRNVTVKVGITLTQIFDMVRNGGSA